MDKRIFALMAFALLGMANAVLIEAQLATAGSEQSLATLETISQLGNNTHATFVSNETTDNSSVELTLKYMTPTFQSRTIKVSLDGTTPVVTTATNYVYRLVGATSSHSIALTTTTGGTTTFTSAGKNSSLTCKNYTNVYYISYAVANYTSDMNATLATALENSDDGTTATIYNTQFTAFTATTNTYPTTLWYYYNPALTLNGWSNTTNIVLPAGEYFSTTTPFTSTPKNLKGTVTISPNADLRTFNMSTNDTASYGYFTIPSDKLIQNKRVIANLHDLEKCVNGTLTLVNGANITTTRYTRSGAQKSEINDIAYIYHAELSEAAVGNVSVNNTVGTVLLIPPGNTTPVDNEMDKICVSPTGCSVSNLFYGGDATWKLTAKVFARSGTSRIVFIGYQPIGMSLLGNHMPIRYSAGERLVWYGTPYADDTNITINYEAR